MPTWILCDLCGHRRKTLYGKTRVDVSGKPTKAMADRDDGLVFDAGKMTVGEWLEGWIDSLPGAVAENTQGFYEHRARTYLKPTLGHVKLSELIAERRRRA